MGLAHCQCEPSWGELATMSYPDACVGPDDEPRLRDEHAFLERQLAKAIVLAEADDWQGFELRWEVFMTTLEQHLKYEETQIFPAFAKSEGASQLDVRRICNEHEELRKEVRFLDALSQQPELFIEQLRCLARTLQAHKEKEGRMLYPWLASLRVSQPLSHKPESAHSMRT